jgi:site-specific DNA-methyltransferase (adenine-specific)
MGYERRPYFFQGGSFAGDRNPEEAATLLADALTSLMPKLATDAHVLVFIGWKQEPQIRSLVEAAGLTLRSSIVWVKEHHGVGDTVHAFAPAHERIVYATAGAARLRMRLPDVLYAPRVKPHAHPTQKPVELLEQLICATVSPGELVCDPFAGVASTHVACVRCGRRAWGCELDPTYYAVGLERIRDAAREQEAEVA